MNQVTTATGNITIPDVPQSQPKPQDVKAPSKFSLKKAKQDNGADLLSRAAAKKDAKKDAKRIAKGMAKPLSKKAHKVAVHKAVTKKIVAKKAEPDKKASGINASACSFCGKPLSRHTSISQGMGDVCAMKIKLLPKGTTLEDHYEALIVSKEPTDYVKITKVVEAARKKNISGYRVMQAIGGERMLRKPINSHFKVVLYKGARWVPASSLKHLDDLKKI